MGFKKLFEDLKRCRNTPETRHIKWDIEFLVDDQDYLFTFLPAILWQPSIYRYPGVSIIDIWWLHYHIVIGKWVDKEETK